MRQHAIGRAVYRHENKAANDVLDREAARLFAGVTPQGLKVTLFCWCQKNGGEVFQARYLLTERGGVAGDAGFSAEGNHQTTDMHMMSYDFSQEKLKVFARGSTCYELIEPVIRVNGGGEVKRV